MYNYDHCDEEQRRILDSTPYYFLNDEEMVNFHFMLHQRLKLKSPDFMNDFEQELLASKFADVQKNVPDFNKIDYNKSFIELKKYDLSQTDSATFQSMINDVNSPPIVAKGLLKDTSAVKNWTHKSLIEKNLDIDIMALDYSSPIPRFEKQKLTDIVKSQLDNKSEKAYYINNSAEIFMDCPELIDEIGANKILELFKGHSVNSFSQLFVGNLATWGSNWHQGNDISCALMINGAKRWYFMDPRLVYTLKPFLNGANGIAHKVDGRYSLDYHRIHDPLYAYAPKLYVDIEPGDVIFFTKYWPHAVFNLTPLQIMANMRMTEVNLESMQKGQETPTLMPMFDNILNSDPDFIKFKFDIFQSLGKKIKNIGDKNYLGAMSSTDSLFEKEGKST